MGEPITDPEPKWVDEEVVRRAITGYPPPGRRLTPAEQREVTRRLLAQGRGSTAIQKALRVNGRRARELVTGAY